MRLFTLFVKRRRLAAIQEHLRMLADQRDSAIAGISVYEGKARRLQDQISALESPATILRALLRRAM